MMSLLGWEGGGDGIIGEATAAEMVMVMVDRNRRRRQMPVRTSASNDSFFGGSMCDVYGDTHFWRENSRLSQGFGRQTGRCATHQQRSTHFSFQILRP